MAPVGLHLPAAFLPLAFLARWWVGVELRVTHPHAFLLWQVFKTWRGCHGPPQLKGQLESSPHLGCGFLAFT